MTKFEGFRYWWKERKAIAMARAFKSGFVYAAGELAYAHAFGMWPHVENTRRVLLSQCSDDMDLSPFKRGMRSAVVEFDVQIKPRHPAL